MENFLRDNKEKLFLFVDAETENVALSEQLNKPWQISWAFYRNNKIEKEENHFIKWPDGLKVSAQAAKITHFNPSKIEQLGKSPKEVLDILHDHLEQADIVAAHNGIGFEAHVLPILYKQLNRTPYNIVPKILDTFCVAKAWKGEIPYNQNEDFIAWQYRLYHKIMKGTRTSLTALAKEFEIPFDENLAHDALYDVKLNIAVWEKLKYKVNIKE
jgi:DNA polymerase III epsilon subunit-like protein